MTTEKGTNISESSVLLEYIEDAYPENTLYPGDIEARAKVRQLVKITELYMELPARRLLPAVMGNAKFPDTVLQEVKAGLEKAVRSITELAVFEPYLLGSELSLADIYMRYALAIPKMVGPSQLSWNVLDSVPGLASWDEMMADTDIARKIDADQRDNTAEFMAYISKS